MTAQLRDDLAEIAFLSFLFALAALAGVALFHLTIGNLVRP